MAGKSALCGIFIAFILALLIQVQAQPLPTFNDPNFKDQFYLNEKFGVTMNIYKAWSKGYNGTGVMLCINDPTGLQTDHSEYAARYDGRGSFNYNTNSSDPNADSTGLVDGVNAHGTKMAGIAAASANNGLCGVGVAYGVSLSGIKLFLTNPFQPSKQVKANARQLARAVQYGNHINDIYSCSWSDIHPMPIEVNNALKNSTENGRSGRGNLYVFSAGNEGIFNGTCGYNEYATSIYTIAVSVVTGKNTPSRQNAPCSAVTAVTYSKDLSTGIHNNDDLMPTCGNKNTCARTTGASSAAAAVASGILALVLQANPKLGWRDVQHLIARSSCSDFKTVSWTTNKANIIASDQFGFGLLDADALTTNAKNWKNVGQQLECNVSHIVPERIDGVATLVKSVDMTSWPGSCGGEGKRISYLEHVVMGLSLNFTFRKDIEIEIISPGGTKSIILRSGKFFDSGQEIEKLSTMSLHFWGENPRGQWKINLRNVKPNPGHNGTLFKWSLAFYGTASDPMALNTIVKSQIKVHSHAASTVTPTTTSEQRTKYKTQTVTKNRSLAVLSTKNSSVLTKPNSGIRYSTGCLMTMTSMVSALITSLYLL